MTKESCSSGSGGTGLAAMAAGDRYGCWEGKVNYCTMVVGQ